MNPLFDATQAALARQVRDFDGLVSGLTEDEWNSATPADGWAVRHQVGHVAFVFNVATLALSDHGTFAKATQFGPGGFDKAVQEGLIPFAAGQGVDVLGRWRDEAARVQRAMAEVDPEVDVPWLVNPLPPAVLGMAGMLELFAHGQDIADGLGISRTYSDDLALVVQFVHRTQSFGYLANDLPVPDVPLLFDLSLPSGEQLTVGPADAAERITGTAADLCLVASRRRHSADTGLKAEGAVAEHWLTIAQAYRGPAGSGRQPGQFARAS